MSELHDYGPLRTYELTWRLGHIETVQGHQVTFDSHRTSVMTGLFGPPVATATGQETPPRFAIHGEFDGHWRLVITAPEADLLSIRDVTDRQEQVLDKRTEGEKGGSDEA